MQPTSDRPAPSSPASENAPQFSAQMEAEIAAAMADLDKSPTHAPVQARPTSVPGAKPGIRGPRVVQAGREQRKGRVVSVGPADIFVEFGPKDLGVLPRIQFKDGEELPKVGEDYEVVVDHRDNDGLLICSRPGAVQKADWELLEPGQIVDAKVTGVNKGGLDLEVAGHRAFMPAGQISFERVNDLTVFVGQKMACLVTKVERMGRGNIVLSRREVLAVERKKQAEDLKKTLAEGQVIEGTVRKIMPFGAFVDLGGIDGLVHVSDMTYDRTGFGEKAVAKHVSEGQKIKVQILKLDWENDRISLGMKQIAGDPFATAVNEIAEGAEVTGRVVRITEFGAFVELAPGVDGLVHISEIDHKRIGKVEDALKPDEIIKAKVLKIDKETRRISLSIRALKPLPEMPAPQAGEGRGPGGPGRSGPGAGPGGPGGPGRGGPGAGRGRGRDRDFQGPSAEEILKETPALRRAREKAHQIKFKGGLG